MIGYLRHAANESRQPHGAAMELSLDSRVAKGVGQNRLGCHIGDSARCACEGFRRPPDDAGEVDAVDIGLGNAGGLDERSCLRGFSVLRLNAHK